MKGLKSKGGARKDKGPAMIDSHNGGRGIISGRRRIVSGRRGIVSSMGDTCMSCAPELDTGESIGGIVGEGRGSINTIAVEGEYSGEPEDVILGESSSIGERLRSFSEP